jgi:hypothetical protein
MAMVSFVDETTAGERAEAWHLEIFEERLALREVIRRRVFQEVAEHNAGQPQVFRGLVQPGDTERTLNGYVRSESCSWNTSVIACGADKDFVLYRFAAS